MQGKKTERKEGQKGRKEWMMGERKGEVKGEQRSESRWTA